MPIKGGGQRPKSLATTKAELTWRERRTFISTRLARLIRTHDSIKRALGSGLWTLDSGLWTLDSGLWTLDSGLWTLDSRLWTLDSGLWTLDSGLYFVLL